MCIYIYIYIYIYTMICIYIYPALQLENLPGSETPRGPDSLPARGLAADAATTLYIY